MFHSGRCGSTVLGDMLNQHPDIFWASEIFNDMPKGFKWYLPNRLRTKNFIEKGMYAQSKKYYGFEIKYLPEQHLRSDCINLSLLSLVDLLRKMGTDFIVLLRKNYLRRALSVEIARTTNEWHTQEQKNIPTPVKIDIDHFVTGNIPRPLIEHFNILDEYSNTLQALLEDTPFLKLCYEDDILLDPTVACIKVAEFLDADITSFDVAVRLKRTNPFNIKDMILNYNEVASLLKGTKYEWMLYD